MSTIVMNITSMSFSYLFLGIALISLSFYLYFRLMYVSSSPDNSISQSIFGEIKHREDWHEKNRLMSHVFLFWTITSIILFIYMKFFIVSALMSILYLFLYVIFIVSSVAYAAIKRKAGI